MVGPERLADQQQKGPEDAVFVEVGDLVELVQDRPLGPRHRRVPAGPIGRIELRLEQADQQPRHLRIGRGGILHIGLAEARPGLAQDLAIGAQDHDLPGGEAGAQDQPVEPVILQRLRPDQREGFLEPCAGLRQVDGAAFARRQLEFLDHDRGG